MLKVVTGSPETHLTFLKGIPVKHGEDLSAEINVITSLSHFGELQQCEVCFRTLFLLGPPTQLEVTKIKTRRPCRPQSCTNFPVTEHLL